MEKSAGGSRKGQGGKTTDVADKDHSVIEERSTSLVPSQTEILAEFDAATKLEQSMIDRLSLMDRAAEILERRAINLVRLRTAAIQSTQPQDWVLSRDREGNELATPSSAACEKISEVYGIDLIGIGPLDQQGRFVPDRETKPNGGVTFRGFASGAKSKVTGKAIPYYEAARSTDEKFIGREENVEDLRSAVLTLLRSKPARIISGLVRVPVKVLQDAGLNTERCTKGHGYGSGHARAAQSVAESGVAEQAEALWNDILRRTGGDTEAAQQVLQEITAFKPKDPSKKPFRGYSDYRRITSERHLRSSMAKLKSHPVFGDGEEER